MDIAFDVLFKRAPGDDVANKDPNIGKATQTSSSISALVSSLVVNGLIAFAMIGLFMILRVSQKRVYSPRTFVGRIPKEKRVDDLPSGMFGWIKPLFTVNEEYILGKTSLDSFFFVRFLKVAMTICLVGCFMIMPLLFPINATGGGGNQQLDILSYGNVSKANKMRLFAHCLIGVVFIFFVIYMIYRELMFYISIRHAYMLSPMYADRISSRTVLFTSVPDDYLSVQELLKIFNDVARIWINTDVKDLDESVKERNKVHGKLEGAEAKYIRLADKNRKAAVAKGTAPAEADQEQGSVGTKWVSHKNRPSHKLKPLIGKKVDTINWSREELQRLNVKVKEMQERQRTDQVKQLNSVFIEFTSQRAAQTAVQCIAHNRPLHMAPRYVGITPEDVIWSNLRIKWWERLVRITATTAFLVALIIFWSIPVAFVGLVSNINYLTTRFSWLRWINKIPKAILGVITGLLPAVMMAVLMALLPIILRLMAKLSGDPSYSQVELSTQTSYFAFQVVQVFLVATLGSAVSSSIDPILKNPSSAASLLAKNIPKASNFYINYFVLQGLSVSAGLLLQIVGLLVGRILGKLLDNTPRKKWSRWNRLANVSWGTLFPVYTNLLVISIVYSCIAPLVLLFAVIGFGLFYIAFKYNFIYVYNPVIDTKGEVYPRALFHIFTGIYLMEVCLIGLFAIATSFGPLVIMVLTLIFTVLVHSAMISAFGPVIDFLPRNLAAEEQSLLKPDGADGAAESQAAGHAVADPPKGNMFTRFFKPHIYASYHVARKMLPSTFPVPSYNADHRENAYVHPALAAIEPMLWIPRDEGGVSKEEISASEQAGIHATDEFAWLDDKSKMQWEPLVEGEPVNPPDYEEKPPF